MSRVFILDAVVDGYRADGSEMQRGFNLKTDLIRLGNMLDEIGGAALIVIDPITAYHIGCDCSVRLRGGGVGRFRAKERRRWPALPVVRWWRHHRRLSGA